MSKKEKSVKEKNGGFSTRKVVFAAMALSLAIVIATVIKLPSLPLGGSTTLFSMLIVCLIGYWYGPKVGLWSALAYGILQFITGPYVMHPLQVLLDYPMAFGALGLSGFFHKSKHGLVKGYIVGVCGRYICHSISGMIFYTTYVANAKANCMAILAGLGYNLTYILPEAVGTIIVLCIPAVRHLMIKLKDVATQEQ